MILLGIPRSGRDNEFVYFMRGKKLCRRTYFIPANVCTPGRRRARGSFGAVVKAWRTVLSEEQRRAWNAAAAKVQSRPRLSQSGPLSGQTHFTGMNNSRSRIGRERLLWPPEPVVFGPNPVEGLSISEEQGRLRLRLRVAGPVVGDIMVFGAPPCSAGRKKWRHGAFLGLLPAPVGGESDITELYVARYGKPELGKRVFIRTKQQREGWEDHPRDVSGVVVAISGVAGVEIQSPKPEIRPKAENRCLEHAWSGRLMLERCTTEQYRIYTGVSPSQYRRSTGSARAVRKVGPVCRACAQGEVRWRGHSRELWRGT